MASVSFRQSSLRDMCQLQRVSGLRGEPVCSLLERRGAGERIRSALVHSMAIAQQPSGTQCRAPGRTLHMEPRMSSRSAAKSSTDVLQLLTAQHAEVDTLFEKIENSAGNRTALLTELADKLAAHAAVEEKVFYPSVMAKSTSDKLHEAVEEHLQIKRVLADLIEMKPDDENFNAKLKVLKEDVSHHAHREEEGKLFPMLRSSLSADQLAAIGNETLAMFEQLMTGHPHLNVPDETESAAPLPPAS
jgi:hemerythrin superfamily protein